MNPHRSRGFEVLAVVFTFTLASWALAGPRASDSQGEETVRRVIQSGGISGWDDKELGRMGDAAAVDVAKFVGGDSLSEQHAGSVLTVIQIVTKNLLDT